MTPEQEANDAPIVQDDSQSISKLMEGVADDGYSRKEEPQSQPSPEGAQDGQPETNNEDSPQTDAESGEGASQEAPNETDTSKPDGAESVQTGESSESSAPEDKTIPSDSTQEQLDEYEREIEELKLPKGATTKAKEVLKILKTKNREEHRAKKALEAERSELLKRRVVDEALEKRLAQLEKLETDVAIEQSPVFQQYGQTIARHEQDAINLLRQWKLPEETAKYINDNGGLMKFQASEAPMPTGVTDLQGKAFRGSQSQWWNQVVKPMLSDSQSDELRDHLYEARKAIRERTAAVQQAKGNPQEFFKRRQAEFDAQVRDWEARANKQAEKLLPLYGEIAKPKDLPANAAPEVKAEIERHNASLEEARQNVIRYIKDQTPESRMEQAMAAAYRVYAEKRLTDVENNLKLVTKERDDLKSKWDAVKKSRDTSKQQGVVQQQKEREPAKKYDAAESMKELLEAVPI